MRLMIARRLADPVLALLAAMAATGGAAADAPPLVRAPDGPVTGSVRDGVRVFTGIPFAAPPVGPLRFHTPQPVAKWTAPLAATRPLPACLDVRSTRRPEATEDCLYLSLWVPENPSGKPLAVMVWSPADNPQGFDGASLARNGGVIVVVNTRRLGLLGTMNDPRLAEGKVEAGDYALKDQLEALRWLKRNVASFGGDPRNITMFGQSAGASFISRLLAAPAAAGLFHKAILQSSGLGAVLSRQDPETGVAVTRAAGCDGASDVAACLRAAPPAAFAEAPVPHGGYGGQFLPLDLPEAYASGRFNRMPLVTGTNLNEGGSWTQQEERRIGHPLTEADRATLDPELLRAETAAILAQYPTAKYGQTDVAVMHAITDFRQACYVDASRRFFARYVPVYAYEVTEPDPAQRKPEPKLSTLPNTPWHGTELGYIFGRNAGQDARARALSLRFQRYWSDFAKSGSPDPGGTEWRRFTPANNFVVSLQEPPASSTDFADRHNCAFFRAKGIVR